MKLMMVEISVLFTSAVAVCPFSGRNFGAPSNPDASFPCPGLLGHRSRLSDSATGLLNEGKGCWGHCNKQAGDCDYCGTGQCCRKVDYDKSVPGCELAGEVTGVECGAFKADSYGLKNVGEACWGHCGTKAGGNCTFCGTGQCCRQTDGRLV